MAIDTAAYQLPAKRSDAGTIAINTALALTELAFALEELRAGGDISKRVEAIREISAKLEKHFDKLASWSEEP